MPENKGEQPHFKTRSCNYWMINWTADKFNSSTDADADADPDPAKFIHQITQKLNGTYTQGQ